MPRFEGMRVTRAGISQRLLLHYTHGLVFTRKSLVRQTINDIMYNYSLFFKHHRRKLSRIIKRGAFSTEQNTQGTASAGFEMIIN